MTLEDAPDRVWQAVLATAFELLKRNRHEIFMLKCQADAAKATLDIFGTTAVVAYQDAFQRAWTSPASEEVARQTAQLDQLIVGLREGRIPTVH